MQLNFLIGKINRKPGSIGQVQFQVWIQKL
jgi:hypothetical protein